MADRAGAADATCPKDSDLPPPDQHPMAGAQSYVNANVYGARASIEVQNPDLCDNSYAASNGFSTAWTMVHAETAVVTGRQMYAQIGYYDSAVELDDQDNGFHYFVQYTLQCNNTAAGCGSAVPYVQKTFGGTPSGTHVFSVKKKNTTGEPIRLYFDGAEKFNIGYDPTGYWDSAWSAAFEGEVNSAANDIPGTPSDKVTLNDLTRYDSSGTAQYLTSSEMFGTSGPRYHRDQYDPPGAGLRAVDIWTDPSHN